MFALLLILPHWWIAPVDCTHGNGVGGNVSLTIEHSLYSQLTSYRVDGKQTSLQNKAIFIAIILII